MGKWSIRGLLLVFTTEDPLADRCMRRNNALEKCGDHSLSSEIEVYQAVRFLAESIGSGQSQS